MERENNTTYSKKVSIILSICILIILDLMVLSVIDKIYIPHYDMANPKEKINLVVKNNTQDIVELFSNDMQNKDKKKEMKIKKKLII